MILLSSENNTDMIDNIDKLNESVVNEAYFGDKSIMPIVMQFTKFRKKWVGKLYNDAINLDPELLKFNRMVEQEFGYKLFSLAVTPFNHANAGIYNIDAYSDEGAMAKYEEGVRVYKTGKGFHYDKKSNVSAVGILNFGFIYRENEYTEREIMAVILHEIGHSFFQTVNSTGNILGKKESSYLKIFKGLLDLVKTKRDSVVEPDSAVEELGKAGLFDRLRNLISLRKNSSKFGAIMHNISDTVLSKVKGQVSKNYGYSNEKFADTFATMYGFGADLSSALSKMEHSVEKYYGNKAPGNISCAIKVFFMMRKTISAYKKGTLDEHPDTLARIQSSIEYLEREVRNETIDPKLKIELQKQIEFNKQLIRDFIEYTSDEDGYRAYRMYYAKLYEKYGGDIREDDFDNDAFFEYIDDRIGSIKKEAAVEDDEDLPEGEEPLNELIDSWKSKNDDEPDGMDESFSWDLDNAFYQF